MPSACLLLSVPIELVTVGKAKNRGEPVRSLFLVGVGRRLNLNLFRIGAIYWPHE